jgi:hypothetical protein
MRWGQENENMTIADSVLGTSPHVVVVVPSFQMGSKWTDGVGSSGDGCNDRAPIHETETIMGMGWMIVGIKPS